MNLYFEHHHMINSRRQPLNNCNLGALLFYWIVLGLCLFTTRRGLLVERLFLIDIFLVHLKQDVNLKQDVKVIAAREN